MMKTKTIIAKLLVLAMVLTMLPVSAVMAAEGEPVAQSDTTYAIISDVKVGTTALALQDGGEGTEAKPYVVGTDATVVTAVDNKVTVTYTVTPTGANVYAVGSDVTPTNTSVEYTVQAGTTDPVSIKLYAQNGELKTYYEVKFKVEDSTETTIKLDKETLELKVGGSDTLKATVTPADTEVTWESSDETIATVDENGKVTAVAVGKATITATAGSEKATCAVTVEEAAVDAVEDTKAEAEAAIPTDASEAEKTVINSAVSAINDSDDAGSDNLTDILVNKTDKDDEGNLTFIGGEQVSAAEIQAASESLTEQGTVRTVVVPKIVIKVSDAKEEESVIVSLTFSIEAFADVKVTTLTAESGETEAEANTKVVKTVSLANTDEAINITLPLPTDFAATLTKNPVVKHKKNDATIFWHMATVAESKIQFVNERGFSEFTAMNAPGVAVIGEKGFATLQEAVDEVTNNGEIVVFESGLSATVSKAIAFSVYSADGLEECEVTIVAGDGYEVSVKDDTFTVTKKSGSTGSTGGGGGGGSSKPSIKPGATPGTGNGTTTPSGGVAGFNDVASGQWYAGAVQYVVDKGLFGGVGNGNFAPNANMTRAMMWTVLARYKGVNTNTGANWYAAAQEWAIAQGISDGTMADGNVTREQFVTMLWRLEGEPAVESSASFTDNSSVSGYAQTAVNWAVSKGIVNGYNDGSFRPQGSATRAEVAKMLMVYCQDKEA